MFLLLEVLNC